MICRIETVQSSNNDNELMIMQTKNSDQTTKKKLFPQNADMEKGFK